MASKPAIDYTVYLTNNGKPELVVIDNKLIKSWDYPQ